jgi:hypothetical protein
VGNKVLEWLGVFEEEVLDDTIFLKMLMYNM